MQYVVCTVPLAPVRVSPDHRAEMSSQLLFGEAAYVLDINEEGWLFVSCEWDGYQGWIRANQFEAITALPENKRMLGSWVNIITYNGKRMQVPFGSVLFNDNVIVHEPRLIILPKDLNGKKLAEYANMYLHTAYCWGGRSVYGIDCSGFVQMIYKFAGITLKRDACMQVNQGEVVDFLQEAHAGDLAFFEEPDNMITHVGMLLNEKEIIHASGEVRIDWIDNQGIVRSTDGVRTHKLRVIKRIL